MTTYYDFTPTNQAPFQFQPTLDGQIYNAVVTWSLFGQRYYLNVYDLSGNLIVAIPLIASPSAIVIEGASWLRQTATVGLASSHNVPIGVTANLTISGMAPDAYNGAFEMLSVSPTQLSYSLASDPGLPTAFGSLFRDINLVAGYFSASTIVYREGANRFEVSP